MQFHRLRAARSARTAPWPTWAAAFAIVLFTAACSNPFNAPDPSAQATIEALAAANASLSTQVAELAAAARVATPLPPAPVDLAAGIADGAAVKAAAAATQADNTAPAATVTDVPVTDVPVTDVPAADAPAPSLLARGDGPLPQLLLALPLAAQGETLYDLRLDRTANRLFVTDSASQLHVLDATTYAPLSVLPYGGWLELDELHHRLYVYRPYATPEPSLIHVIDTLTLERLGTIEGRALSIDAAGNRLFVGEPYSASALEEAAGVRIVDGTTLQQTGVFTQAGAPTFNPISGDLLIAAYTLHRADPQTLQVTGDLFPELTGAGETDLLWCNGCAWVDRVQVFPTEQVVAVEISRHCAGKGCGAQEPPRFLDAATLGPLNPGAAPLLQAGCGSQSSLAGTVAGAGGERRYVNEIYDRYVVYNNLLVTDAAGAPLTSRDGLRIDYVNAATGQGYLYDGTVIDLERLEPIGRWPASCPLGVDPANGLLFGHRNGSLYVIAERGGQPAPPAAPVTEALPGEWPVSQIAISPNFAVDQTLLAVSGDALYRSTDGGSQWLRLAGGLPQGMDSQWVVAFSPTYSVDGVIFVAGDRGEYWGEGVWRSNDGGDSWEALWNGLQHRRIKAIHPAPDFVVDQALVVQAEYYTIATGDRGISYQQSTDGGLSWTLVATSSLDLPDAAALPPLSELLPGYGPPPALPARINDIRSALQVTLDGSTFVTVPLPLAAVESFYALLPAPAYPAEPVLYALGRLSLWRSEDNGATWSAWEDARLEGMDYTNQMSAGGIARLAGGDHRLVVGAHGGQVWVLDPAQMVWGDPIAAVPTAPPPSAVAAGVATATAAAPPATGPITATGVSTGVLTSTGAITSTGPLTLPAAPPASAPTPAVTAEPLAGDPPAGFFRPQGSLGIVWEANPAIQQAVGWARQETPAVVSGAYQRFENGVMVWRQDTGQIFAFLNDGAWRSFTDTFVEGDVESDPRYAPPGGKQQPMRGFGKVWREHADLRAQIGWALAKEEAQPAEVHPFERGQMLRYGGLLFTVTGVDTDSGRWR